MLYGFSVTHSINNSEPLASYFDGLRGLATLAVEALCLNNDQAWSLCEFLDAVDSRAMTASRAEYSKCLHALIAFLFVEENLPVRLNLANKSWAAKTCHELLETNGEPRFDSLALQVA